MMSPSAHLELVFRVDRVDLVVHVEDLALVEGERFNDVVERMGVDRLFKRLAEQILPHFRVGDVFEDREHDVVADEALSGAEESQSCAYDPFFICAELFAFHSSMSFPIGTSVGIQWLAHPFR
jgi:hypothetical protein